MASTSIKRAQPIPRSRYECLDRTGIGSGCSRRGARRSTRLVLNGIKFARTRMDVETLSFGAVERARATAAEHRELVARFVDGTVAVNPFRNSDRGTTRVRRGDEFGRGPRAESREMRGVIPWRQNLQNAQPVLAVGDKSKRAGRDHPDFHVVDVVELTPGSEELIQLWGLGLFDINNREPLLARRNIRVGARNINVARIL